MQWVPQDEMINLISKIFEINIILYAAVQHCKLASTISYRVFRYRTLE